MFENTCTYPLPSELFAQAIHPSEPLLALGLSSGHVSTIRIPSSNRFDDGPVKKRRTSDGTAVVDTRWKTKRHEDSCRCLAYSLDGGTLFSAGSEGIVKAADSETGQVTGKILLPSAKSSAAATTPDPPTVVHALSPQTFLAATDSGALHLYDLRNPAPDPTTAAGGKTAFAHTAPAQTHYPHIDYVSSLTPLPPSSTSTSGYSKQWMTTGGMSLAVTDLRRGVLVKSIDQSELLLSSVYVTGLHTKKKSGSSGEKAVVGDAHGGVTLWEKGEWQDMDERVTVCAEQETLDVLAVVPDRDGAGQSKRIAVGSDDGQIRFLQLGQNKVVGSAQHDEVEGVVSLGFDAEGRMISGGGRVVKVWEEGIAEEVDGEEEEGKEELDGVALRKKRSGSSSEDSEEDNDSSDEEEEEEKPKKRRKKRKKGKEKGNGVRFNFEGLV